MKVEITRWKTNTKEDKFRKGSIKKCVVEVGYGDDWSADWTIATIVLPLLQKVKENKQGSPKVEDEDVPEHLRSTVCAPVENNWETDDNWHKRWSYVLDEMIFAMQEIANDGENELKFHTKEGEIVLGDIDPTTGLGELKFEGWESTPDSEAANRAYHERIQNGCRLIGLYLRGLWT